MTDSLTDVFLALEQFGRKPELVFVGPTQFTLDTIGGQVLFAVGHNVTGWEAVHEDPEGNQTPLLDGPEDPYAQCGDIAEWAAKLATAPWDFIA